MIDVRQTLTHATQLHQAGAFAEAEALYYELLAIHPREHRALYFLAMLKAQTGQFDEALAFFDRTLALGVRDASLELNRANVLRSLGRLREAIAGYDAAIELRRDYALAYNNRAVCLYELRQYDEALACAERALATNPDYAEALNNRGNVLLALRRPDDALNSYEAALQRRPDYAQAWSNRGNALLDIGLAQDAIASFEKALAMSPKHKEALSNLGIALMQLGKDEESATAFARLVKVDPNYEYACGHLLRARLQCCAWDDYEQQVAALVADVQAGKPADQPFCFVAVSNSAADQLLCARTLAAREFPPAQHPLWNGERYGHDRIRVAYVSANFHEHAVAYLLAGLLEEHDRRRFEVFGVSFGPDRQDTMRQRIVAACDRFLDVRRSADEDTARLLRDMEVDIVVDLMGYTSESRPGIFRHRPAPAQVTYIGYPGSMGAEYIDYILADRIVIPEENRSAYTESIIYLPDTYQVNDARRFVPAAPPERRDVDLPETGFVFVNFNNSYKITPDMFDVWMRLLGAVEGSVLWLFEANAAMRRNLQREAQHRGIAPERLVFAPHVPLQDHLARHQLADLMLDTFPYNGHATSSHALWTGVPVVTCMGSTFASRVSASLLTAISMPELITDSFAAYEALALELATDPERIKVARQRLVQQRTTTPLFDTARFCRHLEAAYETMHQRSEAQAKREDIIVPPV